MMRETSAALVLVQASVARSNSMMERLTRTGALQFGPDPEELESRAANRRRAVRFTEAEARYWQQLFNASIRMMRGLEP